MSRPKAFKSPEVDCLKQRHAPSVYVRECRNTKVGKIDYPDLDPDEAVPFDAVKLAAKDLRRRLKGKSLESYLKCTGGKGLHVSVPLAEKNNWEQVKGFCADIAETMVSEEPAAYVATMSKAKRKGKIFVGYFRNDSPLRLLPVTHCGRGPERP